MGERVYIAGPMRGIPFFNFPEFDAARDLLISQGHTVVSPADIDREFGFDALSMPESTNWNLLPPQLILKDVVARDLEALSGCSAVYLLPFWRRSTGARAEVAVAKWLGMRTFSYVVNKG